MKRAAIFAILALSALPAWAQQPPPGGRPEETRWDTPASQGAGRTVPGVTAAASLPADLRGQAVAFPVGKKDQDLMATVFVPSYYDSTRDWPVLLDGNEHGVLARSLVWFVPQAEKHGFILVSIEYLYNKGETGQEHEVWTREGEGKVRQYSRSIPEFLADMRVDEQNVTSLLSDVQRKYSVERRAVACTGFLGAGIMAYRLPMAYPKLFCGTIVRSGGFSQLLMPTAYADAMGLPFYIVYGEKEDNVTLEGTEQAKIFLTSKRFKKVVAEKIPHSGVDGRPDITANYFRSTVDEILGEERATFDRAANRAGRLLTGRFLRDELNTDGSPPSAATVAAGLEGFLEKYPTSKLRGHARYLLARIQMEKLGNREKAEETLREFTHPPLGESAAAPAALLYLVERVVDVKANSADAERWLRRVISPRSTPEDLRERATKLLADMTKKPE